MESLTQRESGKKDELAMQQQREMEKEVGNPVPLLSEKLSISSLYMEYVGDAVFTSKIEDLARKYKFIRRTRPDGNCFFRAFAYSYLEYLIAHEDEFEKFQIFAESSKDKLNELGLTKFILDDFHETFMEVLKRIAPAVHNGKSMAEELHAVFNEEDYSNYVVVYLRLLTSSKIQEEAEFYGNFIEGHLTIEEFRRQEVEPMYKESDHIHIIALCTALGVGVRVEYLDREEGCAVIAHDFPEGIVPKVFLIYRPGHYDIIYPK